jgi:hypothetical protein
VHGDERWGHGVGLRDGADLAREALSALAIPSSLRNALLAPLQAAATRFDPANPNDVRRVLTLLRTYSSIVRVGERTGLIPHALGDPLVADAARIVRVLGG